jgi:hypothetical protein
MCARTVRVAGSTAHGLREDMTDSEGISDHLGGTACQAAQDGRLHRICATDAALEGRRHRIYPDAPEHLLESPDLVVH